MLSTAEQKQAYDATYYARHKEQINARKRAWRQANYAHDCAMNKAYRTRETGWRRAFIARWKLAAGCFDCGYNADAVALDFDHVQGEKSSPIGAGGTRKWSTILAEIDKCVVRCANCHRIKTHRKEVE